MTQQTPDSNPHHKKNLPPSLATKRAEYSPEPNQGPESIQDAENVELYRNIAEIRRSQRHFFDSNQTHSLDFRYQQLNNLKKALNNSETEIFQALKEDLNRSQAETYLTEIGFIYQEIRHVIKSLKKWSAPSRVKTPLMLQPAHSKIVRQAKGCVLIISPWNYPLQLALMPLIGAIAAGNCVVIKPSEHAPASAKIFAKIISTAFAPNYVALIQGPTRVSEALLEHHWDHIFFTGSTAVGKKIASAAAAHLSPVTLELGGKSPCIITRSANIKVAARRVAWGKFFNCGQTCVAPDYLLIHKSVKSTFIRELIKAIESSFSDQPLRSQDYGRIINKNHTLRLSKLINQSDVIYGGKTIAEERYIAPTLVDCKSPDAPIMSQEIFGPVLPIIEYESRGEIEHWVKKNANPLAFYLFTEDKQDIKLLYEKISFGGGCINDTIAHVANIHMPFGGIGASGIGACHGKDSFDTFSHKKSTLINTTKVDLAIRYQPYTNFK